MYAVLLAGWLNWEKGKLGRRDTGEGEIWKKETWGKGKLVKWGKEEGKL